MARSIRASCAVGTNRTNATETRRNATAKRARNQQTWDLLWLTSASAGVITVALEMHLPERLPVQRLLSRTSSTAALLVILVVLALALAIFSHRRASEVIALSAVLESQRAVEDALTGLPNRIKLTDVLTASFSRARVNVSKLAVLFLDLDRFKRINDMYGHAVGDELLVAVAQRLSAAVREGDLLTRLGGDEFVVVCRELSDLSQAEGIAERISTALFHPFFVGDHEISMSISIGIALGDVDTQDPEALLRDADAAMYRAKAAGRGTYAVFDRTMSSARSERASLERRLRQALGAGEFSLVYQPVVSVTDGTPVGVEALLRWQDGSRGLVGPADFVSLLEEDGLIVPVGAWVLEQACGQAVQWRQWFPHLLNFHVAVNVSAVQLAQANFPDVVTDILGRTGMDPHDLCLEITEAALMNDLVSAWSSLRRIKSLGVALSLDDFGTGYSSLSYVRNFALDSIKIDQSFIRQIESSSEDRAIVAAIIDMAHALNITAVAEGIETVEQLLVVDELGCDFAQGYHFSRPQPVDVVGRFLASGGRSLATR